MRVHGARCGRAEMLSAVSRVRSPYLRQIGHRHPAFGALRLRAVARKTVRCNGARSHNVSQDVSLGPAVASCGLVTSGGTAVGAIERHVQCAGDRRVAGVARRHVPGHMSIGARTACCLRHSICWLRDDTRAPMTKRASSRRRSGECALLLRPLNLRYLIGWRCAGLSVDWAARNCGGFAQQLLWHARATQAGVQQARCLSKQDSLHG